MTDTLSLSQLLDVLSALDRHVPAPASPDALLAQVPACIVEGAPDLAPVRVFRIEDGAALALQQADGGDVKLTPVEISPIQREALVGQSLARGANGCVIALRSRGQVFSLLEVGAPADMPNVDAWLGLLARDLEQRWTSQPPAPAPADQANSLVLASRMITTASTYHDMAQAVLYTIGSSMTAVAITLFDRPLAAGQMPQRNMEIALVTADGPVDVEASMFTDWLPGAVQLDSLLRGVPVLNMPAGTRPELARVGLQWGAALGLRVGSTLLGALYVFDAERRKLSQTDLDAYTTLADQIAAAARSRDLLRQTSDSLEETRVLYEANRAILGAQDTFDIMRALRQHIAPDAASITHTAITYDSTDLIDSMIVDYVNTAVGDQVLQVSLDQMLNPLQFRALNPYWNQTPSSVTFIEDVNAPEEFPLADFLRANGTGSYVAMIIRERGLAREAIAISFQEPRVFDDRQRRFYAALSDQVGVVLQNHRLLRDTQVGAAELGKQVRLLQAINRLSLVVTESQEETALLDAGARALYDAVGADHATVALVNPTLTTATVVAEYPAQGARAVIIDLQDNPLYQYIMQQDDVPVLVSDTQTDPLLPQPAREVLKQLGVRSLLVVPLIIGGRLIGSVGLDMYFDSRPLTPDMVEAARTVSAQIALALQNARLANDTRRRAEQLQRITAFSQSVQATLDMETIFRVMLTESAGMFTDNQMSISLYNPADNLLRVVAEHAAGATSVSLASSDVIPITGHIGRVWQTWELLHIPNLPSDPDPNDPSDVGGSIRSWVLAPILARGRILGIVSVGSERSYAYSETDVALFQQMVNQLANAIENAEAYAQSQRAAQNQALVNDISTQIQRQMDIQRMMDVAINQLGQALGARRGRIRLGAAPAASDTQGE